MSFVEGVADGYLVSDKRCDELPVPVSKGFSPIFEGYEHTEETEERINVIIR